MKRKLKRNKTFLKIVATTTALQMVGTGSIAPVFANEEVEVYAEVVEESTDVEEDILNDNDVEVETDEAEADKTEVVVGEVSTTFDVAPMAVELIGDSSEVTVGDLVISDTDEGTLTENTHYKYDESTDVLTIIKSGKYTIALADSGTPSETAIIVDIETNDTGDVELTLGGICIRAKDTDTAGLDIQSTGGDVTILLEGHNVLDGGTSAALLADVTDHTLTIDGGTDGTLYTYVVSLDDSAYGIHVKSGDLVIQDCGEIPTTLDDLEEALPGILAFGLSFDVDDDKVGIFVEDGTLDISNSFIYASGDDFGIQVKEDSTSSDYNEITISDGSVVAVYAADTADWDSYGISGYITLEDASHLSATGTTAIVGLLDVKDTSTVLARGTDEAFSGKQSAKPTSALPLLELNFTDTFDHYDYANVDNEFSIYAYHEEANDFKEVQVTYELPYGTGTGAGDSAIYEKVMFNLPDNGVYTIFAGPSGATTNDEVADDFFYYDDDTNYHIVFSVDGYSENGNGDVESTGYTLFENVGLLEPDWTYDLKGTTGTIYVGLGNVGFESFDFGSVTIKAPDFNISEEAILEIDLLEAFAVDILTETIQENIVYVDITDSENPAILSAAPTAAEDGAYRAYFSLDQRASAENFGQVVMGYVDYVIGEAFDITFTADGTPAVEDVDYEYTTHTDGSTILSIIKEGNYTISDAYFQKISSTPIEVNVATGEVELTLDNLYIAVPDTAPEGTNALEIVSGDANVTLNLEGWVFFVSGAGDGIVSESTGTLTINGDGSERINCLFANSDVAEGSSRTQGYGIYVNGGDLVIENCGGIPTEITDTALPGVFAMGSSTDTTGELVETVGIKVVGGTIEIDDSFVCAFGETFGIDATTVETTNDTYCDIDMSGSVVVVSTTSNNGTGISGNMTLQNGSYINATGKDAIMGHLNIKDTSTVLAKGTEQAFSGYQNGTPFSELPLMDLNFTDNLIGYIRPDVDTGLSIYTYHEDENDFKEVQISYTTLGWDGGDYATTLYPNVMFNVEKEGNHTIFVGDSGATTNDEVSDDFFHHVDENDLNHIVFYVTKGDGTPSATGYTAFDKVDVFSPEWTYTLLGEDTIGVTLGNVGFETFDFGAVTIKAPTSTTYTGKPIEATLSSDLLTAFEVDILTDDVVIQYVDLAKGTLLESAPSAVGSYEAYFSFDFNIHTPVVAYVEYEITAASTSGSTSGGGGTTSSVVGGSSNTDSDSDSTFVPTTTPTTGTGTGTVPTTTTNTPIVAPAVAIAVVDTVVSVDEATGNTVKTTEYSNGAEVVQTVTATGSISAEISGITTKTEMTIPLESAPSITDVVVIVHEDGTREIIKDTAINGAGLRIVLDSDAKIEVIDNAKSFGDVVADSWYEESVAFATSRELFNGVSEGVFAPTGTMTRAMIWQVLYNYQGSETATSGAEWYAPAQAWSIDFGVSDGTNPNSEMTREQLVTLLYRMGGTGATSGQYDSFGDSGSVSDWASDAMNWAVAEGIITGSNGILNPKGNATRAEVAAIMMRFISM